MPAPTYLGLLRENRQFRLLWLGQVVSFFGDWFKTIALFAIVQELTGSATAVAAVLVAKTLPMFLVIPITGPLIDRFDRRWLLLGADFARAALVLGLIAAHHLQSLPLLYTVLVVLVGFTGLFLPARTASIPQLMRHDGELPVAMALSAGTWSVMLSLGAAAGGLAVELVGVDGALLIDAFTYLLSAALLWPLPPLPPRKEGDDPGKTGFVEGLRYLARKPLLALLLAQKGMLAFSAAAIVMLPLYADGLFQQRGPIWVGLLFSARGLGALVGSLGARRVLGDHPATLRAWIVGGHLLTALGLWQAAMASSLWTAALGFGLGWIGVSVVWTFSAILAQFDSDQAYRGRVFSLDFGSFTLVSATVSYLAGWLVDTWLWTPREVVALTGLLMCIPMLVWAVGLQVLPVQSSPRD